MTTTTTPPVPTVAELSSDPTEYAPETVAYLCEAVTAALSVDYLRTLFAQQLAEQVSVCGMYPPDDVTAALRVRGAASDVAALAAGIADRALNGTAGSDVPEPLILHLAGEALRGDVGTVDRNSGRRSLLADSQRWAANLRAELTRRGAR